MSSTARSRLHKLQAMASNLVGFLFLVAMPFVPSSVLAPNSEGLQLRTCVAMTCCASRLSLPDRCMEVGTLGSTFGQTDDDEDEDDGIWADNRRLEEIHV